MLKRAAKRLLPKAVLGPATACLSFYRRWSWIAQTRIKMGTPETLLHFGIAPGDDLLCTVVLRELTKRGHKKLWMMSKYSDLFENNTDADHIVPLDDRFKDYVSVMGKKWQFLEYSPIDKEKDMSLPPKRHIIAELCQRAGVQGEITVRPYFYLRDEEREKAAWARGAVAVQSSGLGGQMQMRNKQWFPERFQELVNQLNGNLKFVQVGSAGDPLLAGAADLRGKTKIRETAAVLANCRLFIGNVGFLMHLARAVECPSVIIFGGREAPWQSGYSCNVNLHSALPCSPCWLWNRCDYGRACMDMITVDGVIEAIKTQLEKPRGNLVIDTAVI
jgi:hypothetical protein